MTVLDFIRKNSILVLIVIAGVALGLVMMDYSGKGSMFSGDFYIKVNGTNYSYQETEELGNGGKEFLSSLISSTHQRITKNFDANENEELDGDELQKANEWLEAHPEVQESLDLLNLAYSAWASPVTGDTDVNIAITRALLHEDAEQLGIQPSKEQVDAFIRSFPAFVKMDGSFDQALYQRLAGYYNGVANNHQERMFRSVVSDLIVWQSLRSLLTDGLSYNYRAQTALIDALCQQVSGRSAWLPASAAGEPAAPTEEELKAYWESHKENYKSEEKRVISVYTLSPAEGSTLDALMSSLDIVMQDLSQANGQGFDHMLEVAAENPELSPFTYLDAEGRSHVTLPACTLADLPDELKVTVDHNGEAISLGEAAFTVESAPSVAEYEKAAAAGKADQLVTIKQVRGFYPTRDDKAALVRVEAIERPVVLSFEEAREKALADLVRERKDNALAIKAQAVYEAMQEAIGGEGGVTAAFAKAEEMGAELSSFGPASLSLDSDLPEGVSVRELMRTPSGKLAPLAVQDSGARIYCVTERTVENNATARGQKDLIYERTNDMLGLYVFTDWHRDAITRYKVMLSEHVRTASQEAGSSQEAE